jgi:hypothetical protein
LDRSTVLPLGHANFTVLLLLLLLLGRCASMWRLPEESQLLRKQRTGELVQAAAAVVAEAASWEPVAIDGPVAACRVRDSEGPSALLLLLLLVVGVLTWKPVPRWVKLWATLDSSDSSARFGLLLLLLLLQLLLPPLPLSNTPGLPPPLTLTHAAVWSLLLLLTLRTPPCFTSYS